MGSGLGLDVGSGFKLSGLPRNNQLMLLYGQKKSFRVQCVPTVILNLLVGYGVSLQCLSSVPV